MTRLNYSYTKGSEELHNMCIKYPNLPIIPIISSIELKGLMNIEKVSIGEVCMNPENSNEIWEKANSIDLFVEQEKQKIRIAGKNIPDKEAQTLLHPWHLQERYEQLHWESAILVYVGDK